MKPEDIKYLVVHCSATTPKMNVDARMIDRWHRQRGWAGIGYHYVIKRNGMVETGRPEDRPGAHVQGVNHISLGICLAGGLDSLGYPENNFTDDQFAALGALLHALKVKYPQAEILGHRDFPGVKKDCPCFYVKEWCRETGITAEPKESQ